MDVLDRNGNKINTVEELLQMFPNSKIEIGVPERIMIKNDDGTVTWVEKLVNRIVLKN